MLNPDIKTEPTPPAQKSFFRTVLDATIGGGLAGATEVAADHPLWTLKTRYQNNQIPKDQKFTVNPQVLYRGFLPNIVSMAPITALQVSVAQGFRALFHPDPTKPPSNLEALSYSAAGGAVSALVGSPTELLMSQQTKDRGFFDTLQHIVRERGLRGLLPGMAGTAARDAKFTVGYGFASPFLKEQFENYMPENVATIAAGLGAGLPVAALSQPWDTLKTAQQTGSAPVTPLWKLAKDTIAKEGIGALYKGSGWRMARVTSAVMIMGEVNERVGQLLKPKQ